LGGLLSAPPTVLLYLPKFTVISLFNIQVKVGRDAVNFIYYVANVPAPPKRYYYYFFFSRFFSVPLCFHLNFFQFHSLWSIRALIFLSFILSLSLVGGGPSFGLYHFHSFFLKECCLFSRCLSVRCGYCG